MDICVVSTFGYYERWFCYLYTSLVRIYVLSSLGNISRNGIARTCVTLLRFLRNCQTFSQQLHHLMFPPAMHRVSIVVFMCISLMTNDTENLFMSYWPFVYPFSEKCLFMSFAHFIIGLSFYCWVLRDLYYSGYQMLIRYIIRKYFLPFCELSFLVISFNTQSFWFW